MAKYVIDMARCYDSKAFRYKNIVYISTWKCAGTYFSAFFNDLLNLQKRIQNKLLMKMNNKSVK